MRLRIVAYVFFFALLAVGLMVVLAWAAQLSLRGTVDYQYLTPPGRNEAAVLPDAPKDGRLALPGPTACQFATYTSSHQWWLDTLLGGGAPLLAARPAVQPLRCTASYTRVGHCGSEFAETEAGQLSYVVFRTDTRASLTRVDIADITATGVVRTDPKRHGEAEIDLEAIVWDFAKEPWPLRAGILPAPLERAPAGADQQRRREP